MWKLLVSPLLQLDVYSCVKGPRVHCLGSRQIDVLNDMSGNTFPKFFLKNRLPVWSKNMEGIITELKNSCLLICNTVLMAVSVSVFCLNHVNIFKI